MLKLTDLTYSEACNKLMCGIGSSMMFKSDKRTECVPRLHKSKLIIINLVKGKLYNCTCGCKHKPRWNVTI